MDKANSIATGKKQNGKVERAMKQTYVVYAMLKMESLEEYLLLEREHDDKIKVKRMYVDIAGDLIAGLLLGQILYWWTPKKDGSSKVSIEHDGKTWIAKGRNDWWDEIRITKKQFDRACKLLEKKNLIETALYQWNGHPTKHLRPNEIAILLAIKKILPKGEIPISPKGEIQFPQRVKSNLPKGENPISPKGEIQFPQRVKSNLPKGENATIITETTSEITSKTTSETTTESVGAHTPAVNFVVFQNAENHNVFKNVIIASEDFEEIKEEFSREEIVRALEDLSCNIQTEPDKPLWKKNHAGILRKYILQNQRQNQKQKEAEHRSYPYSSTNGYGHDQGQGYNYGYGQENRYLSNYHNQHQY